MNGNSESTGVVTDDASSAGDPAERRRREIDHQIETFKNAIRILNEAHEYSVAQEVVEAWGRILAEDERKACAAREGQRRSETLHGEDPQAAQVTARTVY